MRELPHVYLTCAFGPESSDKYSPIDIGTKAGLLTYSTFLRPSRPEISGQWQSGSKKAFSGANSIG